jgi:uncharacterized protein YggE
MMKQAPFLFNAILTAALAFQLLPSGKPASAQAASPTPAPSATPAAAPTPEPAASCGSGRSVQVTGAATVKVAPDRALIQLGVQSNGRTPRAVEAANSAAIQKVLKALQDQRIPAKDIATDLYVIEPIYDDYDSLYIQGYRINNVVAVTLRDVKQTGPVLAAALEAGANQVLGVEFYTSDLRKHRDQARQLAMQAAQEKAQDLASAVGAEAGCVLSISENSWSYYNGWWYGRSQNAMTQNVVQNAPSGDPATAELGDEPVSLGQISVRAEVAASFGLE